MTRQHYMEELLPGDGAPRRNVARVLATAAMIGWLVSLTLPGFWLHDRESPVSGFEILIAGTLFGWLIQAWAAYANIFFLYLVRKAYLGRPAPLAAVLMLGLMATALTFNGMPQNEGGGNAPLQSWGWGAFLWAASLFVALVASATAALRKAGGTLGSALVILLVGAFTILASIVGSAKHSQWAVANVQDRAIFLPRLAAFTVAELCRVPFVDVASPIIPPGERIAVDIDRALRAESAPHFPELPNLGGIVKEGDVTYAIYNDIPGWRNAEVRVQVPAEPARYALIARKTEGGAVIRLQDTETGKVLYEQPLALRRIGDRYGGMMGYCPRYFVRSASGAVGVRQVIEKLVAPAAPMASSPAIVKPETSNLPCDPSSDKRGSKSGGWFEWDGRTLDLRPAWFRKTPGFCSPSYAALVQVQLIDVAGVPRIFHSEILLFDRVTMRPIGRFESSPADAAKLMKLARDENPERREYLTPHGFVTGFTVNHGNSVTVHTVDGDVRAEPYRRAG